MPSEAHVVQPDGSTRDLPLAQLKQGDQVLVKPGEKVPADGAVIKGESSVNEAMLTGESRPVVKKPGDRAIGGAINGEGALTVEIQKTGKETYLSQVIELVRQAQQSRSRTQDLANRAAVWLTGIAGGVRAAREGLRRAFAAIAGSCGLVGVGAAGRTARPALCSGTASAARRGFPSCAPSFAAGGGARLTGGAAILAGAGRRRRETAAKTTKAPNTQAARSAGLVLAAGIAGRLTAAGAGAFRWS